MKTLLTSALATVLLTGAAFAQSSSSGQTVGAGAARPYDRNINGTRDTDGNSKTIDATVGISRTEGETPLDKENRRLDNMIKNICRGC